MALYMADILEPEDKDRLHENLLVGTSKVYSYACSLFIMDFCVRCTHALCIIIGYNGGFPDSFSVGLSKISIKTTFTQHS